MNHAGIIRIAPVTADDIPILLRMVRALAEYERMPQEVTASEDDLRRLLLGEAPAAEAILAFLDDQPAGVAVYFQTFSTFLGRTGIYLEDIFVEERFRGRGVGLALMRYVARQAVARGGARFEWSVLNWNRPSIEFYERLGARPQSEWTMYRLTGEPLARLAQDGG